MIVSRPPHNVVPSPPNELASSLVPSSVVATNPADKNTQDQVRPAGSFKEIDPAGLSSVMRWMLAITCGMLIANVYYGQPITQLISTALGMPSESRGLIVTFPLMGYGAGLLALVPLGDLVENKRLILLLLGIEAVCLLALSVLSNALAFLAAAFLVGMAASTVQVVLPYVSHLTSEKLRGKELGRLVSGIMLGIMLARPVSSFVADQGSWRAIYVLSSLAALVMLVSLRVSIPSRRPAGGPSYTRLIASMGRIFLSNELLRRRGLYHAAMFGAFSVFWTAAPLWLSGSPFNLSQKGIAWVALAGVAGAIAPPFAGWLADSGLSRAGTAAAMVLAAGSFLLSVVGRTGGAFGLAMVVATAVILDFAVSANLVFGQRTVYALGAEERSRMNSLFMATFFVGGAIASAIGGWSFAHFGWVGVTVVGMSLPLGALAHWATESKADRSVG